jgi:hypothetical protein
MEMDGLYDRTTKSDVMKSTFTAVLWFYDDEKLEERRREILEEIRRNMTPGQRARFNSPISAQQRVLDALRTRGLAPPKKPRAPKPATPARSLRCSRAMSQRATRVPGAGPR